MGVTIHRSGDGLRDLGIGDHPDSDGVEHRGDLIGHEIGFDGNKTADALSFLSNDGGDDAHSICARC